jgi:lipopolysaccharide/colanic/teichoic acid biosynthesis glycosyltransferase
VSGRSRRRILIIGTDARAARLKEALHQSTDVGWDVVGFVGAAADSRVGPVLGSSSELLKLVQETQPTDLVLALEETAFCDHAAQILEVVQSGIPVLPMPRVYESLTGRVPVAHIGDVWDSSLNSARTSRGRSLGLKRVIDVLVAAAGLAPLAVMVLPVALAIKWDSSGPVFHRQERVGRYGRRFQLMSFRTTVTEGARTTAPAGTPTADPTTRVGRRLRRYRLDKIPVLLNILKGEMSFIGPHPELPEVAARPVQELPFRDTRLLMKPGVTGWGQIHCRRDIRCADDPVRRLEYDLYYIKRVSLTLDVAIALKTVGAVLRLHA